jgi:N-methylhydantoinase B/oxoprolinase/acetone carboxylase alpha subunit
MGGESQYGTQFGMAHFECAAAGSGALAIKDGLDTAYVGWNPESDMGNIEIWEQNMPMLYIGRSIVPNSGGSGKYRGGCSFMSTWLINKTPHLRLVTSEHSSRVFDNAGMCGGYPAPTCQMHRVVRNTNINELTAARLPIPHTTGTDPHRSDLEKLVTGDHLTDEGPYISAPHKSGDIFTHSYNGGGGYGDVLERDPVKTAWDVENGFLTAEAARNVFGIVVRENLDTDEMEADLAATAAAREELRRERVRRAVPVAEWMAQESTRIRDQKFAFEVRRMYASAMRLSPRFSSEFRGFWGLEPSFTFGEKP